ncbi:MAG TPA: hypothetical protein PKM63_19080 [Panacibacter sp.]|nr:hypothetical protein [Panacibacter sp.]HNP46406.1 hypothetical protein [Panacibacter sp.]
MQKELDYIINRFPEYRGKLMELFSSNDDFRSLCDDYWQCSQTASRFNDNSIEHARMENSYKMLRLDLEQEVLHFLNI